MSSFFGQFFLDLIENYKNCVSKGLVIIELLWIWLLANGHPSNVDPCQIVDCARVGLICLLLTIPKLPFVNWQDSQLLELSVANLKKSFSPKFAQKCSALNTSTISDLPTPHPPSPQLTHGVSSGPMICELLCPHWDKATHVCHCGAKGQMVTKHLTQTFYTEYQKWASAGGMDVTYVIFGIEWIYVNYCVHQ